MLHLKGALDMLPAAEAVLRRLAQAQGGLPSGLSGARVLDQLANSTGWLVDHTYASLVQRIGLSAPFFAHGWGDLGVVDFEEAARLISQGWPPEHFQAEIAWERVREGCLGRAGTPYEVLEGTFRTPCCGRIYNALPPESRTARARLLLPKAGAGLASQRACVVHLAGTGDFSHDRRLNLGTPLLAQNVATLSLESPYYGARKPAAQSGSKLQRVSDLLMPGRATIEESLFLLAWAQRQGFTRLGLCGFSMGGVHAAMTAALYPGPLAVVPLLAPRSASSAFVYGALREATAWRSLAEPVDEDIGAVVQRAAQANLLTAAAKRVLLSRQSAGQAPSSETDLAQEAASAAAVAITAAAAAESTGKERSSGDAAANASARQAKEAQEAASLAEQLLRQLGLRPEHLRLDLRMRGPGGAQRGCGTQAPPSAGGAPGSTLWGAWWQRAPACAAGALEWLDAVLETYTDVTRFPRPQRPDAAVIVAAPNDAYVSQESVLELARHWPGSELRWVAGGHVTAFVLQQPAFRRAIVDSLERVAAPPRNVTDPPASTAEQDQAESAGIASAGQ
ncbi:hypothetical protein WJX81_000552 [Elliptochloris bilobata]|uniref:AB hydrolase-1 domain-containing protein n=1 Tax=Elliptochloris bilobata TaxID=381761 RepID=A0AAW1QC97_9CHLO